MTYAGHLPCSQRIQQPHGLVCGGATIREGHEAADRHDTACTLAGVCLRVGVCVCDCKPWELLLPCSLT